MTDLSTVTVELDRSGIVIDGREEALLCASLFYFRLPHEVWEARLAQVRATGYRAIDVYLPWNFHETAPGVWDFEGRRDVGTFLDLAHEAGLAVIARPGPYICSEWDGGALPAWLALEEGLALRQAEPRYLERVRGWFDRAMPILASRQHGRGGVVAVQLENELDFFDTGDRRAYLTALRDMALAHGIEVPLVACAGQGDRFGATGGVDGLAPAFNFYPDDRSPFIEPEVRRYADLVAERGLPLLVTETNRSHTTLRRLLVSGATVLAPYLQASGFDFGYTPSVGNWGDPGGFMTHDYDFGGYLSPVGEARPEAAEARVLASFVRTLGPALARATTTTAEEVRTTVPTSASASKLVLDGGGTVTGVPNLGPERGTATIPAANGMPEVVAELPPLSCPLFVRDLPLARFGLPGTLRLASADLVGADPKGLEFASRVPSTVALAGDGPGSAVTVVELGEPVPGAPVRSTARSGGAQWDIVVRHPDDMPVPRDDSTAVPVAGEPDVLTRAIRLDLETRSGRTSAHEIAPASESVGVYRGRTHYAAPLDGVDELLIEEASDIVDLALDGHALPSVARFGSSLVVPVGEASRLEATVETWGHSNFDDARLPGLALGSRRGLGSVWSVTVREDIDALWTVEGREQWAGNPAPVRPLGGWSSTRVGRPVTYRRTLPVDGRSHHAVHLTGLAVPCEVSVDGSVRTVGPDHPWLHLVPGEGRELTVTLPHWPDLVDGAGLLRLEPVRHWQVEPQPDDALLALAGRDCGGRDIRLPFEIAPGEENWIDLAVPAGGRSLRFEGEQVRVSAFAGGELLGRVWLTDQARPKFTGGDPGRLWLPGAWNSGTVRLLVRGTAGGARPRLERVTAAPSPE